MPENDFEKQVQQKMDELRFEPSETVWPEVEKEIREKKKRRVIFWLPLFALLLGGAGWLYFENAKNNKGEKNPIVQSNPPSLLKAADKDATIGNDNQQPVDATVKLQDEKPALKETNANKLKQTEYNNTIATNKTSREAIAADKKALTIATNKAVSGKTVTGDNGTTVKNTQAKFHKRKSADRLATAIDNDEQNSKPGRRNIGNNVAINANGKPFQHKRGNNKQTAVPDETIEEEKTNNVAVEKPLAIEDAGKNKAALDSTTAVAAASTVINNKPAADSADKQLKPDTASVVAKNKPSDKTKKKLNWGVHIQAGKSAVSNGFTNFFSGTPSYYDRASGNFSSAPSNNTGGLNSGGSASLPPADIKPGFSFGAGVFMSKALNRNTSLLAGLNYNYISTQITVGAKNTTSASLVQYNTGSASTYINQFHFIELPVSLQKQLSANSRFSLGAGLSFSWLVSTNTLLYNSQNNTYFRDKSQVNKFQWGLQAGIFYKLFPRSFPIQVGPQFYYSANNIFDKQVYGSRHLMFAGLQANIFLPKKKK